MAKERSGSIIEKVRNEKTQRESAVRLEKRTMTFFARVPDVDAATDRNRLYFESKDGAQVKSWLVTELAKTLPGDLLKWLPVIEVSVKEEDRWVRRSRQGEQRTVGLTIQADRYWIALTKNRQQWLTLPWASCDEESATMIPPEDRVRAAGKFKDGPMSDQVIKYQNRAWAFPSISEGGDASYLEFSPDLWVGIQQVINTIERERESVRALLATKKGIKQLIEIGSGAKRLGAGAMAPKAAAEE